MIENVLPNHRWSLGRILKYNNLQLDSNFFDAKLKQNLIRSLLSNKQVDQHDLNKLGLQIQLPYENRNVLLDHFGHGLVFNIISQKIESYAAHAIALNHKFLIPIYAKGSGLVQIYLNDERYLISMNDRHVDETMQGTRCACCRACHPLILKKYSDYFVLSYKDLNSEQ